MQLSDVDHGVLRQLAGLTAQSAESMPTAVDDLDTKDIVGLLNDPNSYGAVLVALNAAINTVRLGIVGRYSADETLLRALRTSEPVLVIGPTESKRRAPTSDELRDTHCFRLTDDGLVYTGPLLLTQMMRAKSEIDLEEAIKLEAAQAAIANLAALRHVPTVLRQYVNVEIGHDNFSARHDALARIDACARLIGNIPRVSAEDTLDLDRTLEIGWQIMITCAEIANVARAMGAGLRMDDMLVAAEKLTAETAATA